MKELGCCGIIMTLLSILIIGVLVSGGCSDTKVIDGIEYDTYGILYVEDKKNPDIEYKVCWGNVVLGIILVETIIAPIYFFGFDMYEPVGKKSSIKGQVREEDF